MSRRVCPLDLGIALAPDTLRAPDVAVNFTPGDGTWATGAPLVVEYAGSGQDEADLREKIEEFHAAGTSLVWVVRLVGERRVEVHEKGEPVRTVGADGTLTAPGVLALPVPVRALYDRDAAHQTTLRNLLSREGYESLDAVRKEGLDAGVLASRRPLHAAGGRGGDRLRRRPRPRGPLRRRGGARRLDPPRAHGDHPRRRVRGLTRAPPRERC